MRAIQIPQPNEFQLVDLPDPQCAPDGVIVRTAFCGLCGTDLEILHGAMPAGHVRYPLVPGHEWTGVVEEVGSSVKNIKPGDRVSVEGYLPCGKCSACLMGEANRCAAHEQLGLTHNGGLAEFVAAPAKSCHVVPGNIGLDDALMVEPASTVVRGIDRARPFPGMKAAVIGCGTIGLVAARVLGLHQPEAILGVDLAADQEPLARRAGMTQFTTQRPSAGDWDLVIVCAQGVKPIQLALDIVRTGGCIVIIGGAPDSDILTIPANLFVMRDLHVEGIFGYTTASWERTLDLVGSRKLILGDLITHRAPIDQFEKALHLVETRSEPIGKVAIDFSL